MAIKYKKHIQAYIQASVIYFPDFKNEMGINIIMQPMLKYFPPRLFHDQDKSTKQKQIPSD